MKPKVHVFVLGGTITMAPQASGGIAPSVSGEDLLATVPGLGDVANISVSTPLLAPGASLSLENICGLIAPIRQVMQDGASGVVIVQGTDTIDETSFLIDLLLDGDAPVVVTGAMRGAKAAGSDGPGNLLAAVTVAASNTRGHGTMVVLNDEIHSARFVEKTHTALPSAFASPGLGPIGNVIEGRAEILLRPARPAASSLPAPLTAPVGIVKTSLGDDDRMLSVIAELGYSGVVIEAMGVGHLPEHLVAAAEELAMKMPVVLATRVRGGPIFRQTYGFAGSERDLIARGLIPAGWLSATKARLLLAVLLGNHASIVEIRRTFAA